MWSLNLITEIVGIVGGGTAFRGNIFLSLYYPIEKIVANYTNTFNVSLDGEWQQNGDDGRLHCLCQRTGNGGRKPRTESRVEDYTTRLPLAEDWM